MKISIEKAFKVGVKNSGLYADLFYAHQDNPDATIPIYSSQRSILGKLPANELKLESIYKTKKALIMYRQGKAGTLFVPTHKEWSCSENAIPLLLKEKYYNTIDLEMFILLVQYAIYEKTTSKSDNANASWDMVKNISIEYDPSTEIKTQYANLRRILSICQENLKKISFQLKKSIKTQGTQQKIKDVFHVTSGIRITQNQVYHNLGDFPCVTAQTTSEGITWKASREWLESFTKNGKKVIVDQPCLTWSKDGYAGKLFYRDYPFYPNDHCGVLIPKKDINLKWFMYVFQPFIYTHVTAKKSQGMLYEAQMENVMVTLPDEKTNQEAIVTEYERLKKTEIFLTEIKASVKKQLRKVAIES